MTNAIQLNILTTFYAVAIVVYLLPISKEESPYLIKFRNVLIGSLPSFILTYYSIYCIINGECVTLSWIQVVVTILVYLLFIYVELKGDSKPKPKA